MFEKIIASVSDRTIYSNYRVNKQHDGFMSFSSNLSFPLKLKWILHNTAGCELSDGFVFAENAFYCIEWQYNPNTYFYERRIVSINVNNGNINWHVLVYNNSGATFDIYSSLVYVNNYISFIDEEKKNILMLDTKTGSLHLNIDLSNIITSNSAFGSLTSDINTNNVYYYYYGMGKGSETKEMSGLIVFNSTHGIIKSLIFRNIKQGSFDNGYPTPPTICNNDYLFVYDLFNNFNCYQILNNDNIELLWNQTFNYSSQYKNIRSNPCLCIQQYLLTEYPSNTALQKWLLLNDNSANIINTFYWSYYNSLPVININKNILALINTNVTAPNDIKQAVIVYDINDGNNWKELWMIDTTFYYFNDLIIINDNLFLISPIDRNIHINQRNGHIVVYNLLNGSLIWKYTIYTGINSENMMSIIPGLDGNNKPMIIVALSVQMVNTAENNITLFAFN